MAGHEIRTMTPRQMLKEFTEQIQQARASYGDSRDAFTFIFAIPLDGKLWSIVGMNELDGDLIHMDLFHLGKWNIEEHTLTRPDVSPRPDIASSGSLDVAAERPREVVKIMF